MQEDCVATLTTMAQEWEARDRGLVPRSDLAPACQQAFESGWSYGHGRASDRDRYSQGSREDQRQRDWLASGTYKALTENTTA